MKKLTFGELSNLYNTYKAEHPQAETIELMAFAYDQGVKDACKELAEVVEKFNREVETCK